MVEFCDYQPLLERVKLQRGSETYPAVLCPPNLDKGYRQKGNCDMCRKFKGIVVAFNKIPPEERIGVVAASEILRGNRSTRRSR